MRILITGAGGMIGRKLTDRLVADGSVAGRRVEAMTLADITAPAKPAASFPVECIAADISMPEAAGRVVAGRPDLVFHLAAVVSGEAEADFDKGYRVNLDGTRHLFEAIRQIGNPPRLVFASSIAVYGGPYPELIDDDFPLAPLTSYGTQKAMGELLLADFSRKGFLDGIGIRLPTICVRPGAPNKAASGFFSNILREPLAGKEAVLPVSDDVRHWFASPRAAVGFLLHAAGLDTARLGQRRSLNMPGISATIGEEIEALRQVAGDRAVRLIRRQPDATIIRIVDGWPRNFDPVRGRALGFTADKSFRDIVLAHVEDELGGKVG